MYLLYVARNIVVQYSLSIISRSEIVELVSEWEMGF